MKKTWLAMFSVLLLALVLVACGGGNDNDNNNTGTNDGGTTGQTDEGTTGTNEGGTEATSYDADAAEKSYQSCIGCHGGNLEGASGPRLSDVGARLSQDEILDVILNGRGSMPPGMLKGDEAENVAAWLADKK